MMMSLISVGKFCLISLLSVVAVKDVGAEYIGHPLVRGPHFSAHGLHATLLEFFVPLTNGTVGGFSYYTHTAFNGITDIPAVRLQIFEITMGQISIDAKLVLEKRVVLKEEDLNKNHTVVLDESERIHVTENHRMGLTNEGAYTFISTIVGGSPSHVVFQSPIRKINDTDIYPKIDQTIVFGGLPPVPIQLSMGVHVLGEGEELIVPSSTVKPTTTTKKNIEIPEILGSAEGSGRCLTSNFAVLTLLLLIAIPIHNFDS